MSVAGGARAALGRTRRARHLRVAVERQFLERLTGAGVPAGTAELLIAREWAILAGETDYTTDTFQKITGRHPHTVSEFLHEHRAEFV